MDKGIRRHSPALLVAWMALFVALGGTVLAAAKINGRTIKVKSLPGNRIKPGSLPANRLKPGTIPTLTQLPGSVNAAQIDTATLGQVPSAVHADNADSAHDAETALNAVNAIDAERINGHSAGCSTATRYFAGACWQAASSEAAVSAPAAALSCATQGGELPDALSLAAFAQQPGIALAAGDEWTGDLPSFTGVNAYSVVTVSSKAEINSAVSTLSRKYRCVIPLVA
ncbi:MAG TPA: hypothetical protein VHU86_10330 [Solirubrobacterales bacterium]|jgi:hypothetical protein|nr:hypothetical protein [Solirubrobacterales bacterium]